MNKGFGRGAVVLLLAMLGGVPSGAQERLRPPRAQSERVQDDVVLNEHSLKYHKPTCSWAKRCTKNCVTVKRGEATRRGARPCKVCGG